jgi:hypothetical protein
VAKYASFLFLLYIIAVFSTTLQNEGRDYSLIIYIIFYIPFYAAALIPLLLKGKNEEITALKSIVISVICLVEFGFALIISVQLLYFFPPKTVFFSTLPFIMILLKTMIEWILVNRNHKRLNV